VTDLETRLDLEAMWRAWLRDPAAAHKCGMLLSAIARAHAASAVEAAKAQIVRGEPWEGVGMSDKAYPPQIMPPRLRNPAPMMPERGERYPLPQYDCQADDPTGTDPGGITHDADSPLVTNPPASITDPGPAPRGWSRPADPTIEAGDPA